MQQASDYAVEVENLEKRFGEFIAVNHISFSIPKGTIYGFLGPNGAGKSTTIRMLCGLLQPSKGTGHVAGLDIFTEAEKIKTQIGYMSQRFSLYEDLTVEENIDFYSGIYHVPDGVKAHQKEWVIEMAGLKEHRSTMTGSLSGGWKQRLALGCAILHKPSILFLDEPTAGVDPINRRRFWNLIYDLADEGVTVFVTTHYMDEAEYVDNIAFIYKGELIAHGSPKTLKSELMREGILEVFCEQTDRAMIMLKQLPEVKEVALFGRGLHLITDDVEKTKTSVKSLLGNPHYNMSSMEQIPPTMEDVFVSLIEARDRQDAAKQRLAK